jgi:hypothetical protein
MDFLFELLFCGSVVLKPGKITSSQAPKWLVILKTISRSCHFPSWTNHNILFIGNIPFSINGITLFALGCEATYISVLHKIPK